MVKLLKIGVVGCGAIGGSLAKAVAKDFVGQAELVALYDTDCQKSKALANSLNNKRLVTSSLSALIKKCDLVIEAAQAGDSYKIARQTIKKGRDIMVMSVGGMINHFKPLSRLARRHNVKVYIPSGAISGIDALKAARLGKIEKITLTTYKNPRAFKGVAYIAKKKLRLDKINKDLVLFSGRAKDALRYFPQNINVAATLSLGGIGPEKSAVRIVASPKTKRNIHEINIISQAGKIFTRTENVIHPDNPKTSYLAVLSAIATLRQILEPVKIGT